MNRTVALISQQLLVAIILGLSLPNLSNGQERDRLVDWQSVTLGSDAKVLEVVDITVNGKSVTTGHAFTGGEDWLDTLSFRVRNISGKTITLFSFGVAFPEIDLGGGRSAMLSIPYDADSPRKNSGERKPMLTGSEVDLKLPQDRLVMLRQISMKSIGTTYLTRVNILPGLVNFADGSKLGGISLRRP
jgi:hypothetical protein